MAGGVDITAEVAVLEVGCHSLYACRVRPASFNLAIDGPGPSRAPNELLIKERVSQIQTESEQYFPILFSGTILGLGSLRREVEFGAECRIRVSS